ncbi:MAG TPA: hypothetical protein VJQ82_06390 [Terriglobales bacterium]|nr:hypothetical protein [Terriglobales bacterium]
MNRGRALYHLIRADFLERVRRYSFLLTLAFAVYLGYAAYTGKIMLRLDDYRGIYNSAWLGGLMGIVASCFLSLVGFYIVKNTIRRDEQTRVGKILATTPMSKGFYTLAKSLSNFAVLAAMVFVMGLAALCMQFLRAEDTHLSLPALFSPLLLYALPAMAFTAALAILFESLPVLRGGAGNVGYFFLWVALLAGGGISELEMGTPHHDSLYFRDFTGIASVMGQMQTTLRHIDPAYKGGSSLNIGPNKPTKRFVWSGIQWNSIQIVARLTWLLWSVLLALLAALFFHRFDPSREFLRKPRKAGKQVTAKENGSELPSAPSPAGAAAVHLTALERASGRAGFLHLVFSELRLMLKGHAWWWYIVAAGLFIACLASPLDASRGGIIIAAWIWPILLWSQMGAREASYGTESLIFSSDHALYRQLPAVWVAGVLVALMTGGGLGIRLLIARDYAGWLAWFTAALFIPTLALALGVWSASSKPFEALYTVWWYVGPANHVPGADFMGTTPASSQPLQFALFTILLWIAVFVGRRRKLAYA